VGCGQNSFSLHADTGVLVDRDIELLEHQHWQGIKVLLEPCLDCRIAAGHRNGYSGGGLKWSSPLVASLVGKRFSYISLQGMFFM
jgi:hypothetical protein